MVFTQCNPPEPQSEKLNLQDLKILDRTSLTSVVEFMHKFQDDATFSPPTKEVLYDSDKYDVSIDTDEEVLETFSSLEDFDEIVNK